MKWLIDLLQRIRRRAGPVAATAFLALALSLCLLTGCNKDSGFVDAARKALEVSRENSKIRLEDWRAMKPFVTPADSNSQMLFDGLDAKLDRISITLEALNADLSYKANPTDTKTSVNVPAAVRDANALYNQCFALSNDLALGLGTLNPKTAGDALAIGRWKKALLASILLQLCEARDALKILKQPIPGGGSNVPVPAL